MQKSTKFMSDVYNIKNDTINSIIELVKNTGNSFVKLTNFVMAEYLENSDGSYIVGVDIIENTLLLRDDECDMNINMYNIGVEVLITVLEQLEDNNFSEVEE